MSSARSLFHSRLTHAPLVSSAARSLLDRYSWSGPVCLSLPSLLPGTVARAGAPEGPGTVPLPPVLCDISGGDTWRARCVWVFVSLGCPSARSFRLVASSPR